MEDFSIQICQIRHDEYEDRLDDAHLMGEPGHQTSGESPYDSYYGATEGHHEEGPQSGQDIRVKDIRRPHFTICFEHMVKDHGDGIVQQGFSEDDDV